MDLSFTSVHKITTVSIEKACKTKGLTITMKGSLKSLSDNRHWHFKKGKLPGVLEITLMLKTNDLILSCKVNRSGQWIEEVVEELKRDLKLRKGD